MFGDNQTVYQFRFERRQLALFLGSLLATLALVFVLGYLVGKSGNTDHDTAATAIKELKAGLDGPKGIRFATAGAEETPDGLTPPRGRQKAAAPLTQAGSSVGPASSETPMVRRLVPKNSSAGQKRRKIPQPSGAGRELSDSPATNDELQGAEDPGGSPVALRRPAARWKEVAPSPSPSDEKKTVASASALIVVQPVPIEPSGSKGIPKRRLSGLGRAKPLPPSLIAEPVPTHAGFSAPKPASGASGVKPADRPALAKAPAADPTPKKIRYSLEGRYYLLVGTYQNREAALTQRESLRRNAYPAFIRRLERNGQDAEYRVMVGRYQSFERAKQEAERLATREKLTPRILKEGESD